MPPNAKGTTDPSVAARDFHNLRHDYPDHK